MGFFSDLKEDLSQAVNELMPEDETLKADEPTAPDESGVSLEEMLKNIDEYRLPEEMETEAVQTEAVQSEPEVQEDVEAVMQEEPAVSEAEPEAAMMAEQSVYDEPVSEAEQSVYDEPAAEAEQSVYDEPAAEAEQSVYDEPAAEAEPGVYGEPAYGEETAPEEPAPDPEMEELLVQMLAEGTGGEPVPEAQEEMVQNEAIQNEAMQDETIIIEESKGEEEEMDMMDMEEMELERDLEASDETSVITQAMTITGDLSTQGSVDVIGTVNGNIDALGKLNITGHVNGNSKAAEIYAESAKINGEIVSEGAVKIGASSVIIGNITATSAAIAGAVKGDIDVRGPVILDASAIVMGNIKSKSVQINNGAVIEGMCSQCYADVSPTTFFDEYKPEPIRKAKAKQGEQRENKS